MLADPFADMEPLVLFVLAVLLTASLGILCFLPRIAPGMGSETWRALLWMSAILTGFTLLAIVPHSGGLRAVLAVPFIFGTWVLTLLPCFYLGTWLRRRGFRGQLAGQTPASGNADGQQGGSPRDASLRGGERHAAAMLKWLCVGLMILGVLVSVVDVLDWVYVARCGLPFYTGELWRWGLGGILVGVLGVVVLNAASKRRKCGL